MSLSATAKRALEAYGGEAIWREAKSIEAVVSARGLAFTLKRRPAFRRARIVMAVERPNSRLTPIGIDPSLAGVLEGGDVRLEDSSGEVVAERRDARSYFGGLRRQVMWDDLDMTYFANYAFWNYFTLPRLLLNEAIDWRELGEGRLRAMFPDHLPTHSRVQDFRFDPATGRLVQHDYTARIISRLATAANVVLAHEVKDGVAYPAQRLVSPRMPSGGALGWPKLIEIEVHEFRLI